VSPNDIKTLRKRLKLTQKDLSYALGVSKLTMSQYETGFRKPGPTALVLLFVLEALTIRKAQELIQLLQQAASKVAVETKDSRK
jgi:DNA-binding transcriptional regulator YiaG